MIFIILNHLLCSDNASQSTQPRPKIFDGSFFTILKEENGKIEAKCTECNEVKKGSSSSTGNFYRHYKSKHATRVKALEDHSKQKNNFADPPKVQKSLRQAAISDILRCTTADDVRNHL